MACAEGRLTVVHHALRFYVVRAHEGALGSLEEGHRRVPQRTLKLHLLSPLVVIIVAAFRHERVLHLVC